jgi:hypothetical protein
MNHINQMNKQTKNKNKQKITSIDSFTPILNNWISSNLQKGYFNDLTSISNKPNKKVNKKSNKKQMDFEIIIDEKMIPILLEHTNNILKKRNAL